MGGAALASGAVDCGRQAGGVRRRPMRNQLLSLAVVALVAAGCQEKAAAAAAVPPKAPAPVAAASPASRHETEAYVVSVSAKANGAVVSIAAKAPLHINPEYPTAFRPEGGTVKFDGDKVALVAEVKKACAAKADDTCETSSPLKYAGEVGSEVSGTLQFSVCEPEKCLIEKVKLVAKVEP
jgi:hypothetical protein